MRASRAYELCAVLGLPVVVGLVPERLVLSEAQPGDHALVLASPFLRTVPGTGIDTDDL